MGLKPVRNGLQRRLARALAQFLFIAVDFNQRRVKAVSQGMKNQ
jgi:hypothetical protein